MTSDLLWEHQHTIESGQTNINHMNASMIHVFTHIPHQNESENIQLFTWAGYQLTLINKDPISTSIIQPLYDSLYSSITITKNYTLEEWRGIRPGNFMFKQEPNEEEIRRRLGFIEGVESFCKAYNKLISEGVGEVQFGIGGINIWASQLVNEIKAGASFLEILAGASGYEPPVADKSPLVIIPHFLELDLGFECSFGFGWDFKKKTEGVNIKDTNVEPSMKYCPLSFQIANDVLPNIISKEAKTIVMECCAVFHKAQQDCDKTLREAHEEANKCLKSKSFCSKVDKRPKSYLTGASIYEWNDGAAPELDTIIKFVLFFVDNGWKTIEEDIAKLFGAFLEDYTVDNDCATGKSSLIKKFVEHADKFLKTDDVKTLLNFARELGKIIERAKYIQIKDQHCTRKNGPLLFDLDITFHFGFVNPTLKDMCKIFGGFTEDNNDRRRRLKMLSTTYPIIPEITLPCIPIYPPFIMLCPELSITTTFGLEIDPDIQDGKIGAVLAPDVSFDITASLGLTIGIWIIDCEIVLGVKISVIALSFPFEIGVNYADHFGLFGSISIDIKVLEFTIFLRFKICFHFFFFSTCPINVVLWQFSVTAYEYKKQLAQWGMGTNAAQSNLPANYNDAMSKIRFYWAFKDDEHKYNHEYDYGWEEDYFSDFTYEKWADDILGVSSCQIKYGTITKEWHIMSDDLGFVNITDPYLCKYNLEGFDKVLVTEVTIQWYSELGMKTCFDSKVKPMFKEKLCCNFALKVYDEIHKVTGIKFAISSYKMIVMDLEENWSNKCAQFFLNIEVQIDHAPYYDDCSDEGWKIAKGIKGEYHVGFHNIFGEDELYHYNGARTCLNWYNSTRATKTLRTFEILYPYDFLMIGMRFWAEAGVYHDPSNWYGIRIANATNYYWMNNMDANCDPTENAFSKWYDVGVDIENISDSRSYCYTDVLMYFDPMIDLTKKYRFDLEIIANVDSNEFWGFSSLVFNTFDNEDICVNNINPVIALTSTYSNIEYNYYGLKYIPSLYYGYVLFDISFDYRFHDISALISLSTDDSNTDAHWVINFDNQQSGIWIRSGTGLIPSDGILTLNSDLASIIVDTDNNDDIVYTKMYIQWDANEDNNFMRVGFGHILGQNIIASVDYDKFKFDTSTPIKYVGFARSLGSSIPDVKWKIYTNNLPTFCISQIEDEKIHKTHNYKQTCIEDETGTTDLIIYDLVTPDCIYYTTDLSNALQYTFTITQPHDYVLLNMKLFAEFTDVVTPHGQCEADDTVTVLFASDGDHFSEISSATLPGYATFNMDGISHLSKLRFVVKNLGNGPAWLSCTLSINGQDYITSDDENYWRIIKAEENGKKIYTNVANSGESKRIWNTADANSGVYKVIFEFSFQNVYGSDYIEIDIEGQPNEDTKIIPKWDPNLDREVCTNKDYYDGISNHLSISCFGSLNATFEHLSQQETFSIKFVPYGVTEYGISDIKLEYGLCRDVLPLIETNIRYNTEYMYWNADELYSISNNYLFGMVKCELDTYESASTYISIGTNNQTQPRFIVRLYENIIEIWTSVHDGGLFGETLIASNYTQMNAIINNKEWFEFYIEWDATLGYIRVGKGYIIGQNVLVTGESDKVINDIGLIIDSIGLMHTNEANEPDGNVITFQFVPTLDPKLCWSNELQSSTINSWSNTKMNTIWLSEYDIPITRIPTELKQGSMFNGPFESNNIVSKTLKSIIDHDYIQLKAKIYGFGDWDLSYPVLLNGIGIYFNQIEQDSLIWYGITQKKCDISTEYKQWYDWNEPLSTLNGLPLNILTNDVCYYDINLYLMHDSTKEPFTISIIGDLQQTKCNAIAQFDIQLDETSDTTVDGYPIHLNYTLNVNNYKYCSALCNDNDICRAWMYNVSGYCWLKTSSDLNIIRKGGYISGICNGENIYDANSSCLFLSEETLIHKGYTMDSFDYFEKHILFNYANVTIDCYSDNMFQVSVSMDSNNTFETHTFNSNITKVINGKLNTNLTFLSQIKFDVDNDGYMYENDQYVYGFESVDYITHFLYHCDSNLYLLRFPQQNNDFIPHYQWQITEPGLNGQNGTISIKGTYIKKSERISSYITVHNPMYSTMNEMEQKETIHVQCIGDNLLNISYAQNGVDFVHIAQGIYPIATNIDVLNVTRKSKLQFSVTNTNGSSAAGLWCNIYTNSSIIETSSNLNYWTIVSASKGNTTKIQSNNDFYQSIKTGEWIWNSDCWSSPISSLCTNASVIFELSFENVFNIDNIEQSRLTLPISKNNGELTENIKIICQVSGKLNINLLLATNGVEFAPMAVDNWLNKIEINVKDVIQESKLRFVVTTINDTIINQTNKTSNNTSTYSSVIAKGIRCSIYGSLFIVSTSDNGKYWNINSSNQNITIQNISNNQIIANNNSNIESNAEWIWNYDCQLLLINSTNTTTSKCLPSESVTFEFSFKHLSIYNYDMSTFKLSQCSIYGYENAFVIEGIGKYAGNYFNLNHIVSPISVAHGCISSVDLKSDIVLTVPEMSEPSCWYIRKANPNGLGCIINIDDDIFETNDDSLYWSSSTDNIYITNNQFSNLTQFIWDEHCSPVNETNCILDKQAKFTFNPYKYFKDYPKTYPTSDECKLLCKNNAECQAWIYKYANDTFLAPICYLLTDLPLELITDSHYVTGLNIAKNQCDCICDDCYPGNKYHYIYIENENQFMNPLYIGETLYSKSCDFSLSLDNSNLILKNLHTGNTLNKISPTQLSTLASSSWTYPVRMILHDPVLIITDDELKNTIVYVQHCTLYTTNTIQLSENTLLGYFYIPSAFAVQFKLDVTVNVTKGMEIMTLVDKYSNEIYFTFGWDDTNTIFVKLYGNQYFITDSGFNKLSKGVTHWTVRVSTSRLQIWATDESVGYQVWKLYNNNNTFTASTPLLTKAYIITSITNTVYNSELKVENVCISDLPFEQFQHNENEFDYNMRCWSGQYKNINRKDEFVSSFVSDAGCASVVSSCQTSFGEDLNYIPYYDILKEANENYNDPSCYAGQFADPNTPPVKNTLCVMLKKCESPKQSLYTKSWGFSSVNITSATCQNIVTTITRKISVEWYDEFAVNYGRIHLTSNDIYTLNNNFVIFQLRPLRFPTETFGNKSVYISLMNLNDNIYGQQDSNLTWTFELNNAFGVKFYRGDRNITERLIASQYIKDILEPQNMSDVRGYCFGNNSINVTYASDGKNYIEIITNTELENLVSFSLKEVSYVSKLRFFVTNSLVCTIYINGQKYVTSTDTNFWSIQKADCGGENIVSRDILPETQSISQYISDAKWIWNYDIKHETNWSICGNSSVLFEFSFYNVDNPDNAPSFYFEWDSMFHDYIRFGFYNASNSGIGYIDNFNLILETGYISNFYSYDIYYDGYVGYHKKIYISDIMFSVANESYNVNWWMYVNILNTTDPKVCFEYDYLNDKLTRIKKRDLQTNALWRDDGRAMWKLNGNTLPGWHTIKYLNTTTNTTINRLEQYPYYFHHPFVSNQNSFQRTFYIDPNIGYDYIEIEFDIYTFCGWDHQTDTISAALAFEKYLEFTTFWTSISKYDCKGYDNPSWMDVIDIVRMNNETHSDISCYAQGMSSPSYDCMLSLNTASLFQKENVAVNIDCFSNSNSDILSVYYAPNADDQFVETHSDTSHINIQIENATRYSKLRINVTNKANNGGLLCNITVNNNTYYSNKSEEYWSILSASNDNHQLVAVSNNSEHQTHGPSRIWNNDTTNDTMYVLFDFNLYHVFIQEYNLIYINGDTQQINITNNTNITKITFQATPLTTCQVTFNSNGQNMTSIVIDDGDYISSEDNDYNLKSFTDTSIVDRIYIDLQDYIYQCRLDLYSDCLFSGDVYRFNSSTNNFIVMGNITNISSWQFYAETGYECYAIFYNSMANETYTMDVEDGGMISESCNSLSAFDSVNISSKYVHYGCYTHVTFQAPNTNSQPFVLKIEAQIDDISTKLFGTYKKSWGFGNLTITPLICSTFSNIVPLKSPIMLSINDDAMVVTKNELKSLQYEYIFFLVNNFDIDINILFGHGDPENNNENYWNLSINEYNCKLGNIKLSQTMDCGNNLYYMVLMNDTLSNTTQEIFWVSWDSYNTDLNSRNFSFGVGSKLYQNTIASLNIYGSNLTDASFSSIDYVTFMAPKNGSVISNISILPIQFSSPKICLLQLDESNKFDFGHKWFDDCSKQGWELRQHSLIVVNNDENEYIYFKDHSTVDQCQITDLDLNTNCFHGPFKGVEYNDYGDYISRYFYVFTNIDYDIIDISLNYYSLCTWNPEQFENDTAYVFINDQAIWKSAPQYEFVNEYCQGYSLYSDWSLYLDYENVLNNELIQCLDLLDQICEYPVNVNFRHKLEKDELYFSVGISAKLNQQIGNEAFGFGNVSITYSKCPILYPLPIGSITDQPLGDLNTVFNVGDMLDISSNSIYYLVADNSDDDSNSKRCVFYLFGGYTMWSQSSSNCTIAGLPIMANYPILDDDDDDNNGYKLGISDEGFLFLQDSNEKKK
eukprot:445311_1